VVRFFRRYQEGEQAGSLYLLLSNISYIVVVNTTWEGDVSRGDGGIGDHGRKLMCDNSGA
jgi:hypothetical protein